MKHFSLSFLLHSGLITLLLLSSNAETIKETITKVTAISEKDFKKQIVQTDDKESEEDPDDARFLSKKNHKIKKETKAKKTDSFKNDGKGEKEVEPGGDGFLPSKPSKLKKKGEDSSTDDDLEGIEIGPGTILNSKEYKFYNYYERIRQQLIPRWREKIRRAIKEEKRRRENEKIPFPPGLYTTKLKVTLGVKGGILKLETIQSSGVELFDKAARDSFNEAEPFAYPPNEALTDGVLELEWRFTVNAEPAPLIGAGN